MGECFFWYRPTRVVPDQRPLNGRCCCCCPTLVISQSLVCFIITWPWSQTHNTSDAWTMPNKGHWHSGISKGGGQRGQLLLTLGAVCLLCSCINTGGASMYDGQPCDIILMSTVIKIIALSTLQVATKNTRN